MTTWRNEGTPFGPIVLQGATGIQLPGTGTATAYKGQCVTGACYHGKPFFLMRSSSRFTEILKEPDRTGLRQHYLGDI